MIHHEKGCYPKWKAPACGGLLKTSGALLFLQTCRDEPKEKEGANSTHSHERHREAPGEKHAEPRPNGRGLWWLSRLVKIRGFLVDLSRYVAKLLFACYVSIVFRFRGFGC